MKKILTSLVLVIVISLSMVFLVSCKKDNLSKSQPLSPKQEQNSNDNDKDNNERNDEESDENLITFTSVCPCFFSDTNLYEVEYKYSDNYFSKSSFNFNKNLAIASLGLSLTIRQYGGHYSGDYYLKNYFNEIGFDNVTLNNEYFFKPTSNTLAYAFAHKKIDEYNVIAVDISGIYDYGSEWANNFLLSDTGNHFGFNENAKRVYTDLKNYIKTNSYDDCSVKIWATGYSRGGGIANVFGATINEEIDGENELNLSKSNVFVYTFEAPQSVAETYISETKNVHNIINNQDIVTKLAPSIYGLKRVGAVYDIGRENALDILKSKYGEIKIEKFCSKQLSSTSNGITITDETNGYTDPTILYNKFFKKIFKNFSNQDVSVASRELYVKNLQPTITGILEYLFNLSGSQIDNLTQSISQKLDSNVFMNLMSNKEDTLYILVKEALNESDISYNDDNLKFYSTTIQNLLYAMVDSSFSVISDFATIAGNISYIGGMHDSLTTYVLLQNFDYN